MSMGFRYFNKKTASFGLAVKYGSGGRSASLSRFNYGTASQNLANCYEAQRESCWAK
jgi:hypothetical protein